MTFAHTLMSSHAPSTSACVSGKRRLRCLMKGQPWRIALRARVSRTRLRVRVGAQVMRRPGIAASATHLRALAERINADGIELSLEEPFYERRSADYLAAQTGIKVAVLPQSVGAVAEAKDHPDLFAAIVARLGASGAYAKKASAP